MFDVSLDLDSSDSSNVKFNVSLDLDTSDSSKGLIFDSLSNDMLIFDWDLFAFV